MHSVSAGFNRRSARDDYESPAAQRDWGHIVAVALIVVAAFAVRYWFNFVAPHVNNYGSCDASEYLRNGQTLYELKNLSPEFWQQCWLVLQDKATSETVESVRQTLAPLKDFHISGPTFPLFLTLGYAVVGAPYDQLNWAVPLFWQSVFSALTCGFIALTAMLAFSRPAGYVAGAIAIFYPAFIVNSGRLYSESLAAFFLSVVAYLTVRGFCLQTSYTRAFTQSLVNGLVAAALQLMRSIMVLVSVALMPIAFMQYGFKKGMVSLLGLLLGFALFAAPWLAFQKVAFGHGSLIVDRVGNYNFFIGNNIDTEGWLSFPYPDGRGVHEKTLSTLAVEAVQKNPGRWLMLQVDKPLRLLKFPWNDFRTAIGPIEFKSQVVFHQLMMLFALIGAVLGFTITGRKSSDTDFLYERSANASKDATWARLFLLFVFALHLAYLFFITVPRYNLSAMPIAIMFAGAGVTALFRLLTARNGFIPLISIVFVSAFIFAASMLNIPAAFATAFGVKATAWGYVFQRVFLSLSTIGLIACLAMAVSALAPKGPFQTRLPAAAKLALFVLTCTSLLFLPPALIPSHANGRWYEWKSELTNTTVPISQQINLPPDLAKTLSGKQLYLMIDTDNAQSLTGTSIEINQKRLTMPVLPSISLTEDFSRLMPVRGAHMREGEWIWSSLTESAGIKNAGLRQWFLIPLSHNVSIHAGINNIRLLKTDSDRSTIYGTYASHKKTQRIPSLSLYSWEKAFYGVENDHGLTDTRYNIRIPSNTFVHNDDDLSLERGLQTGSFNIRLVAAPPATSNNTTIYTVERPQQINSITSLATTAEQASLVHDAAPTFATNIATLPAHSSGDLWMVRVRGNARRNGGIAKLELKLTAEGAGKTYLSPWTPVIIVGTETKTFDIAVPLEPSAFAPLREIKAQFSINDIQPDAATNAGRTSGFTDLRGIQIEIFKMPSNPLHPGNIIL